MSVFALVGTVRESNRMQHRRRLERVLDAVLELNHLAIQVRGVSGRGLEVEALQAKLSALIKMAGVPVEQLHQCDLLTRTTTPHDRIPDHTKAALDDLARAFGDVD